MYRFGLWLNLEKKRRLDICVTVWDVKSLNLILSIIYIWDVNSISYLKIGRWDWSVSTIFVFEVHIYKVNWYEFFFLMWSVLRSCLFNKCYLCESRKSAIVTHSVTTSLRESRLWLPNMVEWAPIEGRSSPLVNLSEVVTLSPT